MFRLSYCEPTTLNKHCQPLIDLGTWCPRFDLVDGREIGGQHHSLVANGENQGLDGRVGFHVCEREKKPSARTARRSCSAFCQSRLSKTSSGKGDSLPHRRRAFRT